MAWSPCIGARIKELFHRATNRLRKARAYENRGPLRLRDAKQSDHQHHGSIALFL